ncbi:MAG: ABC transporter ATP-binding protein [Terriglobia bacterium]
MLIEAVDIEKTYRDRQGKSVPVLENLTLRVAPGEFVSLAGPSGCGKSTLLNLLGCLDRPDNGSYQFDGQDITGWSERRRAELRNGRIGFVFQSFHLLPFLTVEGNIKLPLLYSRSQTSVADRVKQLLQDFDLAGMGHRYPGELSGGQQQRVAIARALVLGADLILADEPTGNLDADSAQGVLDVFERLVQQGKTVLLVTHDPAVARRASRQIRLEGGRIAADNGARKGGTQ